MSSRLARRQQIFTQSNYCNGKALHLKRIPRSLFDLNRQHPFQRVLFSSCVIKYNRFNKSALRVLVLTDQHLVKLDPKKRFQLLKEPIPLTEVLINTVKYFLLF